MTNNSNSELELVVQGLGEISKEVRNEKVMRN